MAGVNKHILVGHLGQNPDVRTTQDGRKVVSLSLAVNSSWRDKTTGEVREATSWHKVVIFNEGLGGVAEKYLKKGSSVYIEGQSLTRKYTGRDGVDRTITETVIQNFGGQLVLLDRAEKTTPDENAYNQSSAPPIDDEVTF